MTPEELDRILSSEDLLEPSSDFTVDVMARIYLQAAEPSPLSFPWFRVVTGLAASCVMAAAGAVLLLRIGPALTATVAPLAQLGAVTPELGYATAAVLTSLAVAVLPRMLFRP
jgi:hypothetical protein